MRLFGRNIDAWAIQKSVLATAMALLVVRTAAADPVQLDVSPNPFGVGTRIIHLVDPTREEVWTPEAGDLREVMAQIFYPSPPNPVGEAAAYFPEQAAMGQNLDDYFGDELPTVTVSAILGAPLAESDTPFPVLIFSHGMNAPRTSHTYLAQLLAARGVVVVTIDHTYWGIGNAFPTGRVVAFADSMIARTSLTSDEISEMMREGISLMSADQAFVARDISRLVAGDADLHSVFAGRLNTDRMIVGGHSMGGMAAEVSCINLRRFAGCLNLDGTIYAPNQIGTFPAPTAKPFLLVRSSQFCEANEQFGRIDCRTDGAMMNAYLARWAKPHVWLVPDSRHNSFSDLPVVLGWDYGPSSKIIQQKLANYLAGFIWAVAAQPGEGEAYLDNAPRPSTFAAIEVSGGASN